MTVSKILKNDHNYVLCNIIIYYFVLQYFVIVYVYYFIFIFKIIHIFEIFNTIYFILHYYIMLLSRLSSKEMNGL